MATTTKELTAGRPLTLILNFTLPLLLALVHWIAPSVRALSHSSLKLQLQFGVDGSAGFYRIEKSGTLLRLKAE